MPSTPCDNPSQSRIAALEAALRARFWRCFSNGKAAGKTFSTVSAGFKSRRLCVYSQTSMIFASKLPCRTKKIIANTFTVS
jgi:hypothetical protein